MGISKDYFMPHPEDDHYSDLCHQRLVLFVLELHISRVIQHVLFVICLLLFNIISEFHPCSDIAAVGSYPLLNSFPLDDYTTSYLLILL